ncbi:MAG: hypothetical protein EZS28_005004 [Streblomastix strix]|uniref:Proteinase inhibitor I42 chagasin domain-containing protein n=1 Tax=Streblomastix strix TaxID=222440 RepID=A0A5J4WYC6_9EUKA|nr:MAG: hypothetical protein EZS28_005004 [Streblomastix strix]
MISFAILLVVMLTTSQQPPRERTQVKAKKDQAVLIDLPDTPSTGYRWELRTPLEEGSSILKFEESVYEAEEKQTNSRERKKVGGGGKRIFKFSSVNKGEIDLEFVRRRPWEKEAANEENTRVFHVVIE